MYLTENTQPSNNGCYGNQSVTQLIACSHQGCYLREIKVTFLCNAAMRTLKLTDDAMSSKWPESARDEGRSEVVLMLSSNTEDDSLWGSQLLDTSLSHVTADPLDCSCNDTSFPSAVSVV